MEKCSICNNEHNDNSMVTKKINDETVLNICSRCFYSFADIVSDICVDMCKVKKLISTYQYFKSAMDMLFNEKLDGLFEILMKNQDKIINKEDI